MPIEISDEKLRQIVHETLRELGDAAAPDLIRKVVRDVIRQLQAEATPAASAPARRLPIVESSAPRVADQSNTSTPGY